jgi:hypothetical protein
VPSKEEKKKILSPGSDLYKVWRAPTTMDRDRKELLRALLEEVIVTVDRDERRAHLTLRWRGGTLTDLDLSLPRMKPRGLHTDELTPGAPWQIRITDELRARFVEQAPSGYLPMLETTLKLGVSRQTVLQRVKRGELEALLVTRGRRRGLRTKVVDDQPGLFHE